MPARTRRGGKGVAGLQDGCPLDTIQLGKLEIKVFRALCECPRLIDAVAPGRAVSVVGVQPIHHVHPLDDFAERGEAVVQAGVVLGIDEHVCRPAVGSRASEGDAASCVRLGDGIVDEEFVLPDAVHVGIVVDTPSRGEALQHPVESHAVVPPTSYEVVEAVSPERGPIAVYLDDEDPGRGFEASPEDIWSRFAEPAGEKERVSEPRVLGLITLPGAGRQEAQGEKGKRGSRRIPTSLERLLVRQINPLYPCLMQWESETSAY